jgi:superfamily I DNA and RNA helicase
MEFISTQKFDSDAEEILWKALKNAFEKTELGHCWHRHPITSRSGPRLEPDFVILHPKWGLNIIEAKGCSIEDIESIEGHTWYMINWYEDEMQPCDQAYKHMWAIVDRLKEFKYGILRDQHGGCKVASNAYVGLPLINEQEWLSRFGGHISAPKREVIFRTDLSAEALRLRFEKAPFKQMTLTNEEWEAALAILKGSEGLQQKPRRPTKRKDSRAAFLRQVEQKMAAFDSQQHQVAVQTPEGPQRIRGLAGTGKTIVLAQKAAYMHVKNPDWNILFTFYSRSLYEQVRKYITRFVQELSQGGIAETDWSKIKVWHGWGASDQQGLYRSLCMNIEAPFRNWKDAQSYFATNSAMVALNKCCEELLQYEIPELFDAILIDEAQDFGENYFRLCYRCLKQPKRLIWGYDEVQSLEELTIPTAETLFGYDADGKPLVDLDGFYPGEVQKDMILYHCYRNPRPVLIAAHSFGLGLKRKGGPVQFIDTTAGWEDIGYRVEGAESGKLMAGQQVALARWLDDSPHLLEQLAGYRNLVNWHLFKNRQDELDWIINDIERNIVEEELRPDEIAVIALDARKRNADSEYATLFNGLKQRNIRAVRVGVDVASDLFRVDGAVTITSIYRAKGNEASLIYVYGFENAGSSRSDHDIIIRRNKAFTAMTRAKGWLVLTGVGTVADELFQEVEATLSDIGRVAFIVPDMAKIQRNLETYENQRRRLRISKANKSIQRAITDLADIDPDELTQEAKEQLLRLLLGKNKK